MPLRDHFRPPLLASLPWRSFHAAWASTIADQLNRDLPPGYTALEELQLGLTMAVDVAARADSPGEPGDPGGGIFAEGVAAPAPTLVIPYDQDVVDEVEVRIFDEAGGHRLVAALEIVSPSNKDRETHRRAFVAKCEALIRAGVSVAIVDIVTTRFADFGFGLLRSLTDDQAADGVGPLRSYAFACRRTALRGPSRLESWNYPAEVGEPLPALPIWLDDDLMVGLDLESTYEETLRKRRVS